MHFRNITNQKTHKGYVLEIVLIVTERIIELNGHEVHPHHAIGEKKNDEAMRRGNKRIVLIGKECERDSEQKEEEKRGCHLDQWKGHRSC